jgi:hypothetical protein
MLQSRLPRYAKYEAPGLFGIFVGSFRERFPCWACDTARPVAGQRSLRTLQAAESPPHGGGWFAKTQRGGRPRTTQPRTQQLCSTKERVHNAGGGVR